MPSTFSILFALAAVVSWIWLRQDEAIKHDSRLSVGAIVDASMAAMAGGLLIARATFVLLHLEYYSEKPLEAVWFWQGGLSASGGAIGAWLGLSVYVLLARKPIWGLADALAIPGGIFGLAGWTTCLLEGCAYGRRMPSGLFISETTDMFGTVASRWPTQSAGVIFSLLTLVLLYWLAGRSLQPGVLAGTAQAGLGLGAFVLGLTRADPTMLIAGMRLDVAGGALMAAAGAIIAAIRLRKKT